MKRFLVILTSLLLVFSLCAEKIGRTYIKGSEESVDLTSGSGGQGVAAQRSLFIQATRDGRLALATEVRLGEAVHSRYTQMYKGIEVLAVR